MGWNLKLCNALGLGEEKEGSIDDLCRFTENFIDRFVPNPVTEIKSIIETISDIGDIFIEPTANDSCEDLIDKGNPCKIINNPDGVSPPTISDDKKPKPEDNPVTVIPLPKPLPKPVNPPYPIYDPDDDQQPEIFYEPINLPVNRKQKDKKTDVSVSIEQTLKNRKFGCLLHEPITSTPVKLRVCIIPDLADRLVGDEAQSIALDTFIAYNALKKGITLTQEIIEEAQIDFSNLGLIYWRNYQFAAHIKPEYQMIFGRNGVAGLATYYNRQNINGMFQIRSMISNNVEVGLCETISEPDIPFETTLATPCEVNECFVPVRNFKESSGIGYLRQMQVVFKNVDGKEKEITIPDPREDLTAEEILSTIKSCNLYNDEGLEFGDQSKLEQNTKSDNIEGYYRFYSMAEDVETATNNASDLFSKLNQLSNCVLQDTPRLNFKEYKFIKHTGRFKAHTAYIFNFKNDGNEPDCIRFDLREKQ